MTPDVALAFVVKTHGILITNTRCRVDELSVMAKSLTFGNPYAKVLLGEFYRLVVLIFSNTYQLLLQI